MLLIITCNLVNTGMTSGKTWENIADVINNPKIQKHFPTYFNVNETKITNKKEIATQFNNFFINIGPHLANKLNTNGKPSFKSYLKNRTNNTNFQFTTCQ